MNAKGVVDQERAESALFEAEASQGLRLTHTGFLAVCVCRASLGGDSHTRPYLIGRVCVSLHSLRGWLSEGKGGSLAWSALSRIKACESAVPGMAAGLGG